MKPGDKVRLLHGKEEGRITKLLPNNQLEIEIEDGFRIPVLVKEVVLVSKAEDEYLHKEKSDLIDYAEVKEGSGMWLGVLPFNDKLYSLYILNDSSYSLLATLQTVSDDKREGQFSGTVNPGKEVKVLELKVDEFSSWPELVFQLLCFKNGAMEYKKPVEVSFKFKADNFFKRKALLPILNKQGFLFALQVEQEAFKVEALKEALNENRESNPTAKIPKPSAQVDLHIEKLTDKVGLSNNEMLRIQLAAFQQALDAALVNNMEEIVFIHGVGNGVLRNELHKKLAMTKGIKFFEDAAKEKFGYGATKVRLK